VKADHVKVARLLKTARGQLDGILAMIEEDRYCMDISGQILAASSILRKANGEVLKAHIRHCVSDSLESGTDAEREAKIDELVGVLEKVSR
jgi:CsoR family transcriptional regulator, copper-sensing transcriptional repressor